MAQTPRAGLSAINRVNMIITISKGTRTIVMPDINGKQVDEVTEILKKYGLNFKIIEIYNDNFKPGTVINSNIDAGSAVDIFNDTIMIYVSKSSEN